MKIAIITQSVSRKAGGLFYSVRAIANHLSLLQHDVMVFSVIDDHTFDDLSNWGQVNVSVAKNTFGIKYGISFGLLKNLFNHKFDIIYINGIWSFSSLCGMIFARITKTPYVVAPRGMLDPWIFDKKNIVKKIYWYLFERNVVNGSVFIHALCESEQKSIRLKIPENNIHIIPNGIDIDANFIICEEEILKRKCKKNITFISRLDKKKNVINMILAWKSICDKSGYTLNICGWGAKNYVKHIHEIIGEDSTIVFHGSVYGEKKQKILEESTFFILPSLSEGLPMAILEAWQYGIPSIMTDYCNIPDGFISGASIRISDTDVLSIKESILTAIHFSESEYLNSSNACIALVKNKYNWDLLTKFLVKNFMAELKCELNK